MSTLLDSISRAIDENAMNLIADRLGTDRPTTGKALSAAIPSVLGALTGEARDLDGADRVRRSLAATSGFADAGGLIDLEGTSAASQLLDAMLGPRTERLAANLGEQTGLGRSVFDRLLPMLAPLIAHHLGDRIDREGGNARAALETLQSEGVALERRGYGALIHSAADDDAEPDPPPKRTTRQTILAAGPPSSVEPNDGPHDDRVAGAIVSTPAPTTTPSSGPDLVAATSRSTPGLSAVSNPGMAWLWPAAAVVTSILVLGLLLNQCGGGDGETSNSDDETTTELTGTTEGADLAVDVSGVLRSDDRFANLSVTASGGQVTLLGEIADAEAARAAVAAAQGVEGVAGVTDSMTVLASGDNILGALGSSGQFNTLIDHVEAAELVDELSSPGPLTLLAPTDQAFVDLDGTLPINSAALEALLADHLIQGRLTIAQIQEAGTVTTVGGRALTVSTADDGALTIGGARVGGVDSPADNGIIHALSSVIVPEAGLSALPAGDVEPGTNVLPTDPATETPAPGTLNEELDLDPITFESGSALITDDGKAVLDQVAQSLTATQRQVEIGGHTDASGDSGTNASLSQARADAVRSYLVDAGVGEGTLTAVGYGQDRPVATNDTPEGRATNRRIEFTILG